MRIAFLGLGLIGGSVARAIRRAADRPATDLTLVAWTPGGGGPADALAARIVDVAAATPEEAIAGADLVVLAGPPLACIELVDRLAGPLRDALRPDATVTDVASTKAAIVSRAAEGGLRFVGGHPMAGRETTGFAAATGDLFVGRPWVIAPAPTARETDVRRVEWLARACGAEPVRLDPAEHDAATAAISHLPLVVAASLVEAVVGRSRDEIGVDWATAARLAASGWRDATRLARGDPAMGAGIGATNAAALARDLLLVRVAIDGWLADLDGAGAPDAARLEARLRAARDRLES